MHTLVKRIRTQKHQCEYVYDVWSPIWQTQMKFSLSLLQMIWRIKKKKEKKASWSERRWVHWSLKLEQGRSKEMIGTIKIKDCGSRIILSCWLWTTIYAIVMLKLDLRRVFSCPKIMTDLKIIIRYDSFVKQLGWDRMTNICLKIVLWNGPRR